MDRVSIKYGDYAPEAKENFTPEATDKAEFVNLTQLQEYNLDVKNYANPCEYGAVLLDSTAVPFPDRPEDENMGYWSQSITGTDYTFTTPIIMTLTSAGQYSSQGFTFTFDTNNNIFCTDMNIQWYRNDLLIANADFAPNSAFYFCEKHVSNFDKAVITFHGLNMPYNRLKIRSLDYGYGTVFTGDELTNAKIIQEIDPLSKDISINIVDFGLKSQNDFEYAFQKKQPITVYFNDNLIQTCFVETSERKGKREWNISANDYIGLLGNTTFMGGIYTDGIAVDLLAAIFTQTNTPYSIDGCFADKTVTGWIPICTCREAIKQICFAIGAVVDTSNSDKVIVKPLPADISQTVPLDRIMQGQKFTDNSTVTQVDLTVHTYVKDAKDITELYKASESGTGENILVKFGNPCYNLSITGGTITKSNANYAIITADNAGCILKGYEYTDIQTIKSKRNPVVLASEPNNVIAFSDFTLVSGSNCEEILAMCYAESIKTSRVNLKIIEGKHRDNDGQWIYDAAVNVGENITAETEYLGNLSGRIISERYSLNGGILIKECEMV